MMKNVLIINGHQPYPFALGKLNATFAEKAEQFFINMGYTVKNTNTQGAYDATEEVQKIKWADIVFVQTPINWMGIPWSFKKYIDEVWMIGMMGELSNGDGRSSEAPKKNYGMGGKLNGRYMVSTRRTTSCIVS